MAEAPLGPTLGSYSGRPWQHTLRLSLFPRNHDSPFLARIFFPLLLFGDACIAMGIVTFVCTVPGGRQAQPAFLCLDPAPPGPPVSCKADLLQEYPREATEKPAGSEIIGN